MAKIKLTDGSIIQHGQLFRPAMPKRTTVPAVAHGMKRASTGEMSAYHHGIEQEDEPNVPYKSYQKPVALHPGFSNPDPFNPNHIGRASLDEGLASSVLNDANNFGNPTKRRP